MIMKEIFLTILDMGVAGGWVILAVLLVRMLLGRVPKKYACLFWIPAGLRLVVPWKIASPVSLFNLIRPGASEVTKYGTEVQKFIPGNIGMMADPQISIGIPAADAVLSGSLPDVTPMVSMNPMQLWEAFGTVVWCAGMAVMAGLALVQVFRLTGRVRTAVRLEGEKDVYQSENVSSPFILGVFRPKIYLPCGLDEALTRQVLLHERMHLRFRDPLTKLLAYGILTVYWFHPLCWCAFVLFCRDVEMRCDEAVLERTDGAAYGKALVLLASGRRGFVTGPLAFGESSVKQRVKHILNWKKPALWVSIGAVAVSVVLLVVCGTDGMDSPYSWMSEITVEDIGETSVRYRADGVWDGKLTPEQTEDFVQCLRNVPADALRPGREKQHFSGMVMDVKVWYQVTEGRRIQYVFRYDGEEVFLCSMSPSVFEREPAWYIRDADLLAFLADVAEQMPAGQGQLIPESVQVGVDMDAYGESKVLYPAHYPAGTWDSQYDTLPRITLHNGNTLTIVAEWAGDTLTVGEDYYEERSYGTHITQNTLTLEKVYDKFELKVIQRNPGKEEHVTYYITHGEDKYIFQVYFINDISRMNLNYVCSIEKAPVSNESPEPLTAPLYILTADTAPADAWLKDQYGTYIAESSPFYGAIRIFHGGDNTVGEANFWLPMYSGRDMYKLLYISVDETGNAASSYVLESRMWDSIHLLAELTSPEKPMMLVQDEEVLYACIGDTAYWLPQWKEPEENTLSIQTIGYGEGTVIAYGVQES